MALIAVGLVLLLVAPLEIGKVERTKERGMAMGDRSVLESGQATEYPWIRDFILWSEGEMGDAVVAARWYYWGRAFGALAIGSTLLLASSLIRPRPDSPQSRK